MGYFRELPDLNYQSPLSYRTSSNEYVKVKNLFRRVRLREDLQNIFTAFDKYQIPDNSRPDTVAEELYGRADLDWVVIICAGIVNIRNEWPLSDRDIYTFSVEKYGIEHMDDIKYYETTEVTDSNGRLIMPAGKIVDPTFTIPDPSNALNTLNPVTGITNYQYETMKNDEKRSIYVLKKIYLQQFLNDMRRIMYYDKSSQYVNERLVQTENTRNTML